MPSKGMKKLREVEKIGLIGLCVLMLGTLGIGTSTVVRGCGEETLAGSFVIAGDEIAIDNPEYREYWTFLSFQNGMSRTPPRWKYALPTDPQFKGYDADEKDLWTFIILDHVAKRMGVTIPEKAIQDWIRETFRDPATKLYSREMYKRFLANPGVIELWATPAAFEKFLRRYLTVEYLVDCYNSLLWPTMDQIYDRWKFQNKRHDFEYVVQSIGALRREIDPAAFTEEEIGAHYALDKVKRNFRIPTRRSFEAVYAVMGDVSDEQMEKLREMAEKEKLVTLRPNEGFEHYYANLALYPIEPVVERLRKEWEREHAKRPEEESTPEEKPVEEPGEKDTEKQGATDAPEEQPAPADEEKPAEKEPPADEEPGLALPGVTEESGFVDPTKQMEPREKYETYFKAQVEKELFLKKLLERLLKDERLDQKGLKAVAERTGLSHFVTERPLDQDEVMDLEVLGGSALRQALNRFTPGMSGSYDEKVLMFGGGEKRGYAILRVLDVKEEHYPELGDEIEIGVLRKALWNVSDVPLADLEEMDARAAVLASFPDADVPKEKETWLVSDIVRLMLRQAKAEERAKEKLDKLMEAVTAGGQTFRAAAEERAYRVFTEKGASRRTRVTRPPEPEEGAELSPEEERERMRRNYRYFLIKGFSGARAMNIELIDRTPAGQFVTAVLTDRKSDAAFAVYVTAHTIPGPEEMPDIEVDRIRRQLMDHNRRSTLRTFFDFDRMAADYDLKVDGLTVNVKKKEKGKAP